MKITKNCSDPESAKSQIRQLSNQQLNLLSQFENGLQQQLLVVIKQENAKETEREKLLIKTTNPNEKLRLNQIFGIERFKAKQYIQTINENNKQRMLDHKTQLGFT